MKLKQEVATLDADQKFLLEINKQLADAQRALAESSSDAAAYSANPSKFSQGSIDNFMDYYNDRQRFFHWQWKVLQRDVATYYGK